MSEKVTNQQLYELILDIQKTTKEMSVTIDLINEDMKLLVQEMAACRMEIADTAKLLP